MENTIYSLFKAVVQKHPDAPAVIEKNRTLSFREFSRLVDAIAGGFPENMRTAGIVMNHRAEMIAALFAVLKRGAAYVPAEPSFPSGRIRYMMEEPGADFVLADSEYADILSGLPVIAADSVLPDEPATRGEGARKRGRCLLKTADTSVPEKDFSGSFGPGDAYITPKEDAPEPDVSRSSGAPERRYGILQNDDAPAYILYTSGTTGRPKGVRVANRNVCHYVRAFESEFHIAPGDVMLQNSVCTFDIFVEEVFASLLNGAALAIPPKEDTENIQTLMRFSKDAGVTVISGFPYLLAEMNGLESIPSTVRLLISGGDVLRGSYVDRLLGQAKVYNTYGPSETTVCASYYRCNGGTVLPDGTYPIGHAVKGAKIQILDPSGRAVKDNSPGEICISGGGVSLGYTAGHDEESKAFARDPDGGVLYHSGDLGLFLPDGDIAFLHRMDTQIMIYGKRVEIMEVESRLYQCDGVRQAVVRAFTDEKGLAYMAAYVVLSGEDIKLSNIKKELSEYLPSFMIPEYFVKMPEIPLNANGKPDVSRFPVVLKEG